MSAFLFSIYSWLQRGVGNRRKCLGVRPPLSHHTVYEHRHPLVIINTQQFGRGVGRNFHWRGPSHGERGARAYNGGLGAEPQCPGALGARRGEAPLKLKAFQTLDIEKRQQIYQFLVFWELELA